MRGVALAIVLLVATSAGAKAEGIMVTLGTATPGGGFPVYGDAVAQTINEVDPSIEVQTRNTKGSTENVPMLEAGQLDLALVQGEVAHEALAGVGRPASKLLIFTAMYTTPGSSCSRAMSSTASASTWSAISSRPISIARETAPPW